MEYLHMIIALGILFLFAIIGCQLPIRPVIHHKLVVKGPQHAVPLYPDEQSYLKTSREKQEGGVLGIVGEVKQNFAAKQIDPQTPIQIVTADDNGAVIKVTEGPMKGTTGFVAKQNVD
jgi:hypothetical protein